MLLHFLTFSFRRDVVARVLQGARARPSTARPASAESARTGSGAVHFCNWLVKAPTRCGADLAKHSAWWRKGAGAARHGVVVSGKTCCAARSWLDPLSTWLRTLMQVCLRALALPVLRYLTLCYACTVHDRRRWMHVLWSQHHRACAARR
jgi:hypothetical protein